MGIVGLGWYISGLLALLAVLTSAITYAPTVPRWMAWALPAGFGGGAVFVAALTIALSRLPPTHWLRLSRKVWAGFAAVAATVTVLAVLLG